MAILKAYKNGTLEIYIVNSSSAIEYPSVAETRILTNEFKSYYSGYPENLISY